MRSGELRHRITFQEPSTTADGYGQTARSYTDVATVYAAVEPNAGRKYYEAQQANSEVQGVVRIRYRSDVQPEWRIKYGSRYLEIVSIVNPQERNRELLIYYKEAQD